MPKSFLAVTPPQMVQFTSIKDQNVPIPGAGMHVVPCTIQIFLFNVFVCIFLNVFTSMLYSVHSIVSQMSYVDADFLF